MRVNCERGVCKHLEWLPPKSYDGKSRVLTPSLLAACERRCGYYNDSRPCADPCPQEREDERDAIADRIKARGR